MNHTPHAQGRPCAACAAQDTPDALRADIAADVAFANEIMADIADALAKGSFAYASVRTDYLQGRIKSAASTAKRIAKLEAAR